MRKLQKSKEASKSAHDGGLEVPGYMEGTTHNRAKVVETTSTKEST